MSHDKHKTHWILWPFVVLWHLVATVIELTARFVAILLGVVLIFVGAIVCLTIVGAIVGIPLIIFGFLLMMRGMF